MWARTHDHDHDHDDDDGDVGVAQDGGHTPSYRSTETCSLGLPFTSLILDIRVTINDTCQNKLSAEQYHVTISGGSSVQLIEITCFLKLTADQVLVFDWIAGSCHVNLLKTGQNRLFATVGYVERTVPNKLTCKFSGLYLLGGNFYGR